jgi:hypothetical protein
MLHEYLNVPIPSRSLTPQISTALFHRDRDLYLIAVNNGNEDKVAEVTLDGDFLDSPRWQAHDLVSGKEWTVNLSEFRRLTFPLPRKDGTILHLQGKWS